ncbi:hypothetical protein [Methylophaga frappieri]|uniref:hypothetical protein n=1 Tax=Methylophaga frappieri (strain ATCC BAA-2434 / DSM 25690 / JAM7) TaxID=754477 RepID=UPI00059DCA61|nr:hypothetical protein [Methylophaga frappieri]
MPVFEPEIIIAGFAAVAAWIAALFAFRSYRVSKRALELAELQNDSLRSNISAYLADSFRAYNSALREGKYIFSIAYANKSEASDSITEISLETFYVNSKDRVGHLISAHEENAEKWLSGGAKPASLPIVIQPRSSVTGWFVFGIPPIAEGSKRVEKYRVVARNANGEEVSVESYILREMKYEEIS